MKFNKRENCYVHKIKIPLGQIEIWLSEKQNWFEYDVYFHDNETGSDTTICLKKTDDAFGDAVSSAIAKATKFLSEHKAYIKWTKSIERLEEEFHKEFINDKI
jgi:hypothetical protein